MPQAGTNGIPEELENKLLEAKKWYDQHAHGLESWNSNEIEASSLKGADLLMDIVEAIDRTWGFAPGPLPRTAP